MSEIYLVEKLWTDSSENEPSLASGYEPIGYMTGEEASSFISPVVPANGWPLPKPTPQFRISKLEHFLYAES